MTKPALVALIVVLPLTLGLRSAHNGERLIDSDRLTGDAGGLMRNTGWTVRPVEHHLLGRLVEGIRGDCRILVHFASPEGLTDDKFRAVARRVGPVSYSYRGQSSRQFPRTAPLLAWHVQRYAWSFGLAIPTAPLIATARSPTCGLMAPDFTGLGQHLQAARPG